MTDGELSGGMYRVLAGAAPETRRRVVEIRAELEERLGEPVAPADVERALMVAAAGRPEALYRQLREEGRVREDADPETVARAVEDQYARGDGGRDRTADRDGAPGDGA